jgi:nucleotide-binding universal stress UspA family protein
MPVGKEKSMYRHILVPTDGSLVSARAEKAAIEIARKFKARITAVHVVAPFSPRALGEIRGLGPTPMSAEEYRAASEKRGTTSLEKVVARARRAKLSANTVLLTSADPGEALAKAAREHRCDLIVMGSSSRAGIERIFLGSVASEVLNGTQIPTLVCH